MEINAVNRAVAALRQMEEPTGAVGDAPPMESAERSWLAKLSSQLDDIAMISRTPAAVTGPNRATAAPANAMEQVLAAIVKLNNQIGGLSKEMTKLKGQTIHVAAPPPKNQEATPANNRGGGPGVWTTDRQPICYECKEIGHMGRDCPVRARRLANLRSGNGNAPQ